MEDVEMKTLELYQLKDDKEMTQFAEINVFETNIRLLNEEIQFEQPLN